MCTGRHSRFRTSDTVGDEPADSRRWRRFLTQDKEGVMMNEELTCKSRVTSAGIT